ncbi:O-antigen ligase family protein [Microbacterium bovistercoris]|nr:O-antigen ligase family protein [Microbacterium bovistercoris]
MTLRRAAVQAFFADLWANVWRWVLFAVAAVLAVYFALDRDVASGAVDAIALGVLVIGVALTPRHPMALPMLAVPAVFVTARVGFGGGDLTVSDLALALAFMTVVLLSRHDFSPTMRALLWLNAVYQFTTLLTVIVNPFPQNTVEWFHAWLLISGALLVGWGVGRAGLMRTAFLLMFVMGAVIALGTIATAVVVFVTDGFQSIYPLWPWPMHKNFAGSAMALVALIAFIKPAAADLPRKATVPVFWLMLVGIALTQSRQAAIGLLLSMLIFTLRSGASRHKVLVAVLAIPGAVLIVQSVIDQIQSQNRFNSTYQRLEWFREVYALWKHSPIFGHGLRYWYVHPTANFQPPQAELEVVASAGLVGLAGFIVMWIGFLVVLWKFWSKHTALGALAFTAVFSRIVQGQFDLFWVSAQVSIPFVIAGVCLGAQVLASHRENSDDSPKIENLGEQGAGWRSATMSGR